MAMMFVMCNDDDPVPGDDDDDVVKDVWCFIFVFHEEHRKYHEYPEY